MPITFTRINHFQICVPPERLEEAKSFYTTVMGLEMINRPDDVFDTPGYWFNIGDTQLHVGVEEASRFTERHTALEVADIVSAQAHLQAHGIQIFPQPKVPGWDRFAFVDPFGNRMELLQLVDNSLKTI